MSEPRENAIDLLARTACADAIRDGVHLHLTARRLPKADIDAVRQRAREVEAELRPTAEEYERAWDLVNFGEASHG